MSTQSSNPEFPVNRRQRREEAKQNKRTCSTKCMKHGCAGCKRIGLKEKIIEKKEIQLQKLRADESMRKTIVRETERKLFAKRAEILAEKAKVARLIKSATPQDQKPTHLENDNRIQLNKEIGKEPKKKDISKEVTQLCVIDLSTSMESIDIKSEVSDEAVLNDSDFDLWENDYAAWLDKKFPVPMLVQL